MIATLAMYDIPEAREQTDRFWIILSRHLREEGLADAPLHLDRSLGEQEAWRRPDLIFSQSCGYPVMTRFADDLRIVATPVYEVEGADSASYRSALIVRSDETASSLLDFRDRTAAVNNLDSQSGYNTFRAALLDVAEPGEPFFGKMMLSGGHRFSIAAVSEGRADIAAIDCVSLAMVSRYAPAEVAGIRILDWTPSAPALPWVTRKETPDAQIERMRRAIKATFEDEDARSARGALFLAGYRVLPDGTYQSILDMKTAVENRDVVLARS